MRLSILHFYNIGHMHDSFIIYHHLHFQSPTVTTIHTKVESFCISDDLEMKKTSEQTFLLKLTGTGKQNRYRFVYIFVRYDR